LYGDFSSYNYLASIVRGDRASTKSVPDPSNQSRLGFV
jgi:hypothetical protein